MVVFDKNNLKQLENSIKNNGFVRQLFVMQEMENIEIRPRNPRQNEWNKCLQETGVENCLMGTSWRFQKNNFCK
jgi:hypothetical protein